MREGRHNGHGQGGGLRGGEWVHSGHIQQTLFTSSAHNCLARPTGPVDYSSYHHDDANCHNANDDYEAPGGLFKTEQECEEQDEAKG